LEKSFAHNDNTLTTTPTLSLKAKMPTMLDDGTPSSYSHNTRRAPYSGESYENYDCQRMAELTGNVRTHTNWGGRHMRFVSLSEMGYNFSLS
jgi:hypothetical protein